MNWRALRILLFPLAVPLVLLGWALYVVGDRQAESSRPRQQYVTGACFSRHQKRVEFEVES